MLVRDRTLPKTDYKGRETQASEAVCPCRPCYNAHDCGRMVPVYSKDGRWTSSRWESRMECASRYNKGCPEVKPCPVHVYSGPRGKVCKRCGARRL